jgi:replicative DNA helicase
MEILHNRDAENAVIAGIFQNNGEGFFDVADLLDVDSFMDNTNKMLYRCFDTIFKKNSNATMDVPTILATGNELGFTHFFDKEKESQYIKSLSDNRVGIKNMRSMASVIRNLQIARVMRRQLEHARTDLLEIKGDEGAYHILGIAESAVFDLSSLIKDNETGPARITDNLYEYIKSLGDNPVEQLGISTGWKYFDAAIGGGLRNKTVNIIGARSKGGKSYAADKIGSYIAKTYDIPVLNCDTEMGKEDHIHRIMAMHTGCYVHDIETGKYILKEEFKDKVLDMAKTLENNKLPYYHLSIAGMGFEEQLAVIRRWIIKNVGLNPDGTAKPCIIIYDYLKLMDTKELKGDLKEYQLLGFMVTTLHNFAVRYNIPILAFMQLNRDGLDKEDISTASLSDRIIWLCSNFSILKVKSDEEIAEDGIKNGNRKLVPILARHGAWDSKNYINLQFDGSTGQFDELLSKYDLMGKQKDVNDGQVLDDGEDIPFD